MMRVLESFDSGFKHYMAQEWDAAISDFKKALEIKYEDGPSRRYLERCKMFRKDPPASDWDGVFTMENKE
jgi:adenylate cyclase